MTGVRDEEKERYDRKSLALSPPPASPETCSTHPQHSGLAPPPWIRSVSLLCFHTFSLSLLSLSSTFCCSNSIHHLFCASQTYSFSSPPPLSLRYQFIAAFGVYFYNLVICVVVAVDTPTSLSVTSLFLIHWHYLTPFFLYLCSLPLLCVCIILSLALAHSHPPPSHTRVEHKQAAA